MALTSSPRVNLEEMRCGAYIEHWEYLDKPQGWEGCSLPKGHKGPHMDKASWLTSVRKEVHDGATKVREMEFITR